MKVLSEEKKKKAKLLIIALVFGMVSAVSFLVSTRWMLGRCIVAIVVMAALMGAAEK